MVSRVHRIPFQQALLEYLGEIPLFTALYENRVRLNRLIHILDEQVTEMIRLYADSDAPVVQFTDNLDGVWSLSFCALFGSNALRSIVRQMGLEWMMDIVCKKGENGRGAYRVTRNIPC